MKLITFDFWNTLFLDTHEDVRHRKRINFAHTIFSRHQDRLAMERVEEAFRAGHEEFSKQWNERLAFTMSHHVQKMIRFLQLEIPEPDVSSVVDFFETILLDHPPLLIPNADTAVLHATSKMKVGIVSDAGYTPGRILRKILDRNGFEGCFQYYSFSNETGVLKPNKQAFLKILEETGIEPEDAVHIGDLEASDISGAKEVGMKAIKYVGSNPTESRESIADAVIDDLKELAAVLETL